MNDDLPEGWAARTLGEFASRVTKGSTPTSYGHKFQTSGIRFVKVENIRNGVIDHESIHHHISTAVHASQSRSALQEGDILFSIAGTIGQTCLVGKQDLPANTNQALAIIRGTQGALLPNFLTAQLQSVVQSQARQQERGGGMNNISLEDVRAFIIDMAPIDEQRRIVEKIEVLHAKARSSQERLDKIPTILKRFRQAILAAACDGRLTADWRKEQGLPFVDDASAEGDLPTSWATVEFGSLISEGPQNGLYKPSSFYGDGTLIVRIDAFYDGTITAWSELKRLRVTDKERVQFGLCDGDILINRVNSPKFLGKVGLVRSLMEPCVYESNMMRIRLNDAVATPEYAIMYLLGHQGVTELRKNAKHAVNQSSINQEDVKAVLFNLPPPAEQREIVRRVKRLFALADRLEARYEKATAQVARLTQSMLAKAFRGELVPTEAELARWQGREYETAEQLLARIKTNEGQNTTAPLRRRATVGVR